MYYKKALKLQAYLDMLEDGGSCFLYSCLINSAKTPDIMVTYSCHGEWLRSMAMFLYRISLFNFFPYTL